MKKVPKSLVLALLAACMITFSGCKKDDAEIPAITAPAITTAAVSGITTTSALTGGFVTSTGGSKVTLRGVCWSTGPGPTVADNKTTDGTGSGTFSSNLDGLTPNTTYYVRAYATNIAGTAYGNEISFTANQIQNAGPTLTTYTVYAIASTSAVSGGNITADGGDPVTTSGICWGTDVNPTINNNKTTDGFAGIGSFTSNLGGLDPGTIYFVRAYAVNSTGIAYGNEVTFSTPLTDPPGQKAYYPGGARYEAASFSIGTKVYLGIGYNDGDFPARDLWEWDQATNVWTRKADFPGSIEGSYLCFSIGSKGYIETGSVYWNNVLIPNEFWEYDPATNAWTQKATIPVAPGRRGAVGFSIGTKGYIGTGVKADGISGSYYQDFWEWDQETNVWTQKTNFPGNIQSGAVGFSIGSKGYIGSGSDGTNYIKDFWEWDQATDIWTKKADFGGTARGSAVGFTIGNKAYIGTGHNFDGNTFNLFKDFWEWDQASNVWIQKSDFIGDARTSAVGVSIGNKAYIGTGRGDNTPYAFQDFWEYDPALN